MINEREKMTPSKGYNVLFFEDYDPKNHGEDRLTLLKHVDTWDQAQIELAEYRTLMPDDADNILLYPMNKKSSEEACSI